MSDAQLNDSQSQKPMPTGSDPKMDTATWTKLDAVLRVKLNKDNADFADEAFVGSDKTFPIADMAAVETARAVLADAKLSDELTAEVAALIDARAEALKAAVKPTVESLTSEFKAMGLNDAEAGRAAVLTLIRTTELSDDERAALFKPAEPAESAEDAQLKSDYAKLVEDHAELKTKYDTLLAAQPKEPSAVEDAKNQGTPPKVENPVLSEDIKDKQDEKPDVSKLSAYKQKVVARYIQIRDNQSAEHADRYLNGMIRSKRLQRDFDINLYVAAPASE